MRALAAEVTTGRDIFGVVKKVSEEQWHTKFKLLKMIHVEKEKEKY